MRRIETIRRFQRLADENRLIEVAMSFKDAQNLFRVMTNAIRHASFNDDVLVIHYLSARGNRPSLISPQIEIQRAAVVVAVETCEKPDDSKFDLDNDEIASQIVDFQNAIDDI